MVTIYLNNFLDKYLLKKKILISLNNFINFKIILGESFMKQEVFYGKGMAKVKEDEPDLYQAIVGLNDAVWNGKALDYKTQKLIAIGIAASNGDSRATEKQIKSAKKELDVSYDEVVDVLRVVLLTSGMQPFNKALQIANKVFEE